MSNFKFLKKLTAAEVGNTKTHEVYIRIPNDFDFESFFNNSHVENGSVVEVSFNAVVSTRIIDNIAPQSYDLRFVYFANSNKEKRIPGLGQLFKSFNVKEGDIVCLEKKEDNSYSLTFLSPDTLQIYNGGLLINGDIEENQTNPTIINHAIIAPINKTYELDELAQILREMNASMRSTGIHLFGLKYGQFLSDANLKELCRLAEIPESYNAELNKMRNLYSAIKEHKYGVCFYDDFNFDLKEAMNSTVDVSGTAMNYLRAMRTKPFLLLAGISGTGKSRIVKQMAFDSCPDDNTLRSDMTSPGNYCLIEVKPNWHDSTELLGYESKINGNTYQLTPFVKFLAKAMLYPDVPFFVCLDEMNLAPVEQYFAEFLSVLESRTKLNDGHIVSEPLIKADIFANKDYELKLQDDLFGLELKEELNEDGTQRIISGKLSDEAQSVYDKLKAEGLRIPGNAIIVGTVNMDETTHQFSRKVIDRAMTIEMNLPEGNPFMDFFANASELEYRANPTSPSLYLATETKASDVVKALAADNEEKTVWLKGEVAEMLTGINSALEGTPFKIAYRVQNELMLYFYQLWIEDKTVDWSDILTTAVDQILMMKVLPRIEGDEELLDAPLKELHMLCDVNNYEKAATKIEEMQTRLEKSRFTSFWP